MVDENTSEDTPETPEEKSSDTPKKNLSTPLIEEAKKERIKLEAANARKAELLDKEEAMMMRQALGGQSEAGRAQIAISPEDKKTNNAKEFFKGTALGDAISKTNE